MLKDNSCAHTRDLMRRPTSDFGAVNTNGTFVGTLDPHDELHHGRFARSVGADKAEYFSGADLQRHVLHGDETAKPLGQAADDESDAVQGAHDGSFDRVSRPKKPLGNSKTTTSAIANTTKFDKSPSGRRASLIAIKKSAPRAAPRIVRRPPTTAAMMI